MTAAVRKKTSGPHARAQGKGFLRRRTPNLTKRKRTAPKPAEMAGAMRNPAKMVARPLPPFQPQLTESAPPTATPTPATAETIEQVVETGHDMRVQIMSHEALTTRAQVKARSCTPALPSKMSELMMPFLIVSAVRAPTATAPANSMTAAASVACFIVSDLDATDVANELATSLAPMLNASRAAKMVPMAKR